jgi:tetratricopeptide (TPR) repeat protein
MPSLTRRPAALLLVAALALAACESPEEKAEGHYQRGMALLEEGDVDRALLEFRNVFEFNGSHTGARLQYARLLRDQGNPGEALSHYLRLVEQDRNSLEGHRELAELALMRQDFNTATTATERAFALAPEDPQVRALKATLEYRDGDRAAALEMARGVVAEVPDSIPARMILIADRMNENDPEGALAEIDAGLAEAPEDDGLHLTRLAALEQIGDNAATGAQLVRMAELFPENQGVREALIQWHLREGDLDAAEELLRAEAARTPDDPEGALTVVQFLYELRGAEAARAELERLVATETVPGAFTRALARLDFAEGRRDEAIAALRGLTEGVEPSNEVRDIQAVLAQMLEATGDTDGRDALVETILAGDPQHVEALKLRARRLVAADQPEQAIRDLRTALTQAPRDPEIMTIMAMAHEREGATELMGERLAMAVEVSDRAPAESLRYARYLLQDGRIGPAEGVVIDALRRAPQNRDLLVLLGQIHIERRDWARANQVAGLLRQQGDAGAEELAAGLEMAALRAQDRTDETIAMLEGLAGENENTAALVGLMQSYIAQGDIEAAQTRLDTLLAEDPESLPGRMMQAGLHVVRGELDEAEALYRAIAAEAPTLPQPHQALYALLAGQDRTEDAAAALEAGLEATGGDANLMFLQAGALEAAGDFEGAIAIYEDLYARDTSNAVLANNLASLITTHRTDPESLERAFAIARRLRDSEVPHFQDTYGWILHRRGDSEQALPYLEAAATGLPDNPLVLYHLGEVRFTLGRTAEARDAFARAVELAGEDDPLPQVASARARLAEIGDLPEAGAEAEAAPVTEDGAADPETGAAPAE